MSTAAATAAAPAPIPRWLRLAPIVFFQLYLAGSVALFASGPWLWPIPDPVRLYVYLAAAHLALLAGYLSAARSRPRGYFGRVSPGLLLRLSVGLTLVLWIPTLYDVTGGNIDPIGAIRNPGQIYYQFQAMNQAGEDLALRSLPMLSAVRLLCAPLLALLLPLTARRWGDLSRRMRVLAVLAVFSTVSIFVFTGRNKGLMDLVLLLPWLFAIYLGMGRRRLRPRRLVLGAVLFGVALLAFLNFFVRGNAERQADPAVIFAAQPVLGGMQADLDNWMVRDLSPTGKGAVLGLSFTQTHGYYALSLALEKPFEPTWGVGHSYFLMQVEHWLTGRNDLGEHSYPARLESENGWSISQFWCTTYAWLASDVSFPGSLLLLFLIGRLFAQAWCDSLRGDNPFAMGMLVLLVSLLYYLPANNTVLGSSEGFAAFYPMLLLWRLTRRRVVVRAPVAPGMAEPAPA